MKSCYVLGNGPSLAKIDNLILDSLPTFGSNRIFLKYIPTYYLCVNPLEAQKYPDKIMELPCEKWVTDKIHIPGCRQIHSTTAVDFSTNPALWMNEGYSVTYCALQLAFFYGFTEVLLLGVDHRYIQPNAPNREIIWKGKDPNHFSDDYVKEGDRWNCADLVNSEKYYKIAKDIFEKDGRKIINLTENSALNVFEKGLL